MARQDEAKRRAADQQAVSTVEKGKQGGGRTAVGRLADRLFGRSGETSDAAIAEDPIMLGALTAMRGLQIKPTPMAYTVFYTHVAGDRSDLNQHIEELKAQGERFTAGTVAEIYEHYFGANQESQAVYEASQNIERLLTVLQEGLDVASADTASHGAKISLLNDRLHDQSRVAEIKEVVAGIVGETTSMRMSINKLERRVVQGSAEIAMLRETLEEAQREANADPLTGIPNRKVLEMELRRATKEAEEGERTFTVLMIDIDNFKKFNDEHGHQIGDIVLKLVAKTISQGVKRRDLAARFGGEEFCVILNDTRLEPALAVAEDIRASVAAQSLEAAGVERKVGPVTVSLGVAQHRVGEPLKRLVGRADRALYRAKELGRDQVVSERDIEVHGRPKTKPPRVRA